MNRLLFIVVAFIAYGSLYPFEFRPAASGLNPLPVLLHSWPTRLTNSDYGDIVVNLVVYMPVGMFGFLALDRTRHHWLRWIAPVLLAALLSASMEMLQVYDETRVCSLLDLLDNTLGGFAGTLLGYLFRKSMSDGVFLVFHWLGFQIVALCAVVIGKRPAPHFAPLATFSVVAAWGVVLYLLAIPGVPDRRRRSAKWLAGVFLALLAVRGLAPFRWKSAATPFHWIPLHTLLTTEWIVSLPFFFEKSFYYGTAIWLLRSAGMKLSQATAIVAVLLAAIEAAQQHLPNRTPETTDPFLAVILGWMLWLIEQDYRRVREFELARASS